MKIFDTIPSLILIALLSMDSALAQHSVSLGGNAALRYWSAFSAVQDSGITDQQAKQLNAILDGTAPYDDSKYKESGTARTLMQSNPALLYPLIVSGRSPIFTFLLGK